MECLERSTNNSRPFPDRGIHFSSQLSKMPHPLVGNNSSGCPFSFPWNKKSSNPYPETECASDMIKAPGSLENRFLGVQIFSIIHHVRRNLLAEIGDSKKMF